MILPKLPLLDVFIYRRERRIIIYYQASSDLVSVEYDYDKIYIYEFIDKPKLPIAVNLPVRKDMKIELQSISLNNGVLVVELTY